MGHRDNKHSAKWQQALKEARSGDTGAWRKILRDGPRAAVLELFIEFECGQADTRWGVKNRWSPFAGVLRLKALKILNELVYDGGAEHCAAIEMLQHVSKPQDVALMLELIERSCYEDEWAQQITGAAFGILRDIAPSLQGDERLRVSQVMTTMLVQGRSERDCVDVLRWLLPFEPARDALLFVASEGDLFARSGLALIGLLDAAPAEYLGLAERLVSELAIDYLDERQQSRRGELSYAIASAREAAQLEDVGRGSLLHIISYLDELEDDPTREQEFAHFWNSVGEYDEAQEERLRDEVERRFVSGNDAVRRFALHFFSYCGGTPGSLPALIELVRTGRRGDALLAQDGIAVILDRGTRLSEVYACAVRARVGGDEPASFRCQIIEGSDFVDELFQDRWRWLCDEQEDVTVRVAAAKCCEDIIGVKRSLEIERLFGASPDELRWALQLVHDRIDTQHRELLVLVRQFLRDLRDAGAQK